MVETERRLLVHAPPPDSGLCPFCDSSPLVEGSAAAALFGIGLRELYRLAESGAIHVIEPSPTSLSVCLRSAERHLL